MTREELIEKWLEYKTEIIQSKTDFTENDSFIDDYDVSDDDFVYLINLPIKVILEENL